MSSPTTHPADTKGMRESGGLIAQYNIDQRRRGFSRATITHRQGRLRLWVEWLDPTHPYDATTAQVDEFIDARNVTDRTRYSWLSALHCFYAWAIRAEHTDHDPTATIIRPRLPRLLPRPVSDDDLAAALRAAAPPVLDWLRLGAYAGLRCGEIAGLCRDDVLTSANRLRVRGKGGKERLVPIHAEVARSLRGLPHRGPIFRRADGLAFSPWQVSHLGRDMFLSLSIDATMHQCRHWFGTKLYQGTRDLRLVQEMMGHSSSSTTAGYAAFASDEADGAVGGLPTL